MTKKEIKLVAATMQGLWPHAVLAPELWDELYLACMDYPVGDVQAALRRRAEVMEFPPSPSQIAKEVRGERRAQAASFLRVPHAEKGQLYAGRMAAGFVPLVEIRGKDRLLIWIKRSDAVKQRGKWRRKIDFVLEVLGAKEVMKRMGELGLNLSQLVAGEFDSELIKTYRQLLDVMVEAAKLKEAQRADVEE